MSDSRDVNKAAESVREETERGIMRRAEYDLTGGNDVGMQLDAAHRYPRSLTQFKKLALELATHDEETAAGCFYAIPRAGKNIEGPSVRLAEIVASAWGNLRAAANVIGEDERFVYAEGICWDLERNTAIKYATRRRITDKNGNRFNDDMIAVTANAACSIALRNAVFKVVPMVFSRDIYNAARQVAVGDASTLADNRAKMFAYFQKMGVGADRILAVLQKAGVEDVTLDDMALLKGAATAIKDGEAAVDEVFPPAAALREGVSRFGFKQPKAEAPPAKTPTTPPPPTEPPKRGRGRPKKQEAPEPEPEQDNDPDFGILDGAETNAQMFSGVPAYCGFCKSGLSTRGMSPGLYVCLNENCGAIFTTDGKCSTEPLGD